MQRNELNSKVVHCKTYRQDEWHDHALFKINLSINSRRALCDKNCNTLFLRDRRSINRNVISASCFYQCGIQTRLSRLKSMYKAFLYTACVVYTQVSALKKSEIWRCCLKFYICTPLPYLPPPPPLPRIPHGVFSAQLLEVGYSNCGLESADPHRKCATRVYGCEHNRGPVLLHTRVSTA
jgi:hypothetical protein